MGYIPFVLLRQSSTTLVLAAILTMVAIAPLCAPRGDDGRMPCCRDTARCDFGMRTAECCRIAPAQAPASSGPAVHPPSIHAKTLLQAARTLGGAMPIVIASSGAWHDRADSGGGDSSPPAYILNHTLLR